MEADTNGFIIYSEAAEANGRWHVNADVVYLSGVRMGIAGKLPAVLRGYVVDLSG